MPAIALPSLLPRQEQVHRFLLFSFLAIATLFVSLFITVFLSPASAAHASTTSCGQAVCSVSTTVRGVSDWQTVYRNDYRAANPSRPVPNPNVVTYRVPCSVWLPNGGGTSTGSYPAVNSAGFTCHFSDGGFFGGGAAGILFRCLPLNDRASNGRIDYYVRLTDGKLYYSSYRCLYPTDAYAPKERKTGEGKVYTGGRGNFLITDASAATSHGARGTQVDTSGYISRGVDLRYPERYAGAWTPSFDAKTAVTASGEPRYGYYRLDWALDYRICAKYEYPGWLNQPVRVDCARSGTDKTADPYTYACDTNPPLRPGVRAGASFDPSNCVSGWSCSITDHIRVGGNYGDVFVLRNGEPSKVTWNARAVTGGAGTVEVLSWQQKSTLADNVSPRNPDVRDDHRDQWFQTSWDWEQWETIREDGDLSFYWASDPGAPFHWETEYRFHGRFLVTTQASLGAAPQNRWVLDSADCGSTQSPDVTVLRSVNTLPAP